MLSHLPFTIAAVDPVKPTIRMICCSRRSEAWRWRISSRNSIREAFRQTLPPRKFWHNASSKPGSSRVLQEATVTLQNQGNLKLLVRKKKPQKDQTSSRRQHHRHNPLRRRELCLRIRRPPLLLLLQDPQQRRRRLPSEPTSAEMQRTLDSPTLTQNLLARHHHPPRRE